MTRGQILFRARMLAYASLVGVICAGVMLALNAVHRNPIGTAVSFVCFVVLFCLFVQNFKMAWGKF